VANRFRRIISKINFGLERVTASYDLNVSQLEALLQSAPPEWFEVTIHQHMPMFHMEHCVFCAFLSSGTDYTTAAGRATSTTCGCATAWARNIRSRRTPAAATPCFNSQAQTGAEYVENARARRAAFPRGISERNAGKSSAPWQIPPAVAR
jgi:U32 family peptidase